MKELRSAVNALFLFAIFLLMYAAVVPGHARGSVRGPRFLRMQVEDRHQAGNPVKVSMSVPYGLVSGALRFASLGKVRRELDLHFDESVDAAEVRTIVQELKDRPEGTVVAWVAGAPIGRGPGQATAESRRRPENMSADRHFDRVRPNALLAARPRPTVRERHRAAAGCARGRGG